MPEHRFKKGDLVTFNTGLRIIQGVVKEDRGPLGLKGRHLYLVEFGPALHADAPSLIELPAVELQLVPDRAPILNPLQVHVWRADCSQLALVNFSYGPFADKTCGDSGILQHNNANVRRFTPKEVRR